MRNIYLLIIVLLHSCFSNAQNFDGVWRGELAIQGQKLPLVFDLKQQGGKWKGFMQSPAQSVAKIPITQIEVNGDSIKINVVNISLMYRGAKVGSEIKGQFKQGAFTSEMLLTKVEGTSLSNTMVRKQIVQPPYSYDTVDVKIKNKYDDIELAGTLTYPRKKGKYPAVLLLTGSGPQNRDEELFGHKPFKVLADYLTRNGIVVLRVDDRGVGQSTGNFETSTIENFSKDAISAFSFLVNQDQVDKKKVGIIGHSEGGLIAELLAGQNIPSLSYIGLLAAPSFSIDKMMVEQLYAVGKAAGMSEKDLAKARVINVENFNIVKSNLNTAGAYQKMLNNMVAANIAPRNNHQMERELLTMLAPAYRYFIRIEPEKYIKKIRIPVFAAFGTLDVQVPSEVNLKSLSTNLPKNSKNLFKEYKGLNHLFQTARTGQVSEYASIEETMVPQVMEDIANWINSL